VKYLAKDGDTLDMLCYKYYKSLESEIYSEFLRANEHLLKKDMLKGGDMVNFPDIAVKPAKKVAYLWE